jgi:hypothetical protein
MIDKWELLREHIKEKKRLAEYLAKEGGKRYREDAEMMDNLLLKMKDLDKGGV